MVTQNVRISPPSSTLVAKRGYVTPMAHPISPMGIEHRDQPKSPMSFTLLREEARIMKQLAMIVLAASVALIGLVGCGADKGPSELAPGAVALSTGTMTGGQVVAPPAGFSTAAQGNFTGVIDVAQSGINFTLAYQGLSSDITLATIHLARPVGSLTARQVNGQIALYLCASADFPRIGTVPGDVPNRVPASTVECSVPPGDVTQPVDLTGRKVAGDVQANTAVQPSGSAAATSGAAVTVGAGDLLLVLREIKAGNAYVLVRSKNFPAGEIRGQIPAQP